MYLKLVKRPKSPYWKIRGTTPQGVRVEQSTFTADKKLAEEIRIKRENELMMDYVRGRPATVTFAHAVADYMEHGDGEGRFLKPLLDHFGVTLLREIGQHEIDLAAKKLLPKAANATRNRQVYTPMSAVIRHASRKGWRDPLDLARPKVPPGVIRFLNDDERERLIAASAKHMRPLIVFLLNTGARISEALWLDWSFVDLEKKQVRFVKTKNGEARSVPLNSRVLAELTALKHRKGEVFLTPAGTPYARPKRDNDTSAGARISTGFAAACRRAGIADFTPHSCRHDWATNFYQRTHNLAALKDLGGWKTVSMVLRYAHTDVSNHAEAIEKLSGGILGDKKTKGSDAHAK